MKRITILIVIMLSVPVSINAQDIIVKKDGSIIKAKVTRIGESEVEYKKSGSTSDVTYAIGTSNILSINFESGDVETFSHNQIETEIETTSDARNKSAEPDDEKNEELIRKIDEARMEFIKEQKNRPAAILLSKFAVVPNSVLANKDIIVSIEIGFMYYPKMKFTDYISSVGKDGEMSGSSAFPAIRLHITNRTAHTLYLDLGNSFVTINNISHCYYTPGATSQETSKGSGASVNLGAVAGALGVGGAVGALANGISVGGGNSTSSTTVTYNQRVVAVPPLSTVPLEPMLMIDESFIFTSYTGHYAYVNYPKTINKGCQEEFNIETSPFKVSVYVSYSDSESCACLEQISCGLYVKTLYGVPHFSGCGLVSSHDFDFSPDMLFMINYVRDPKREGK